MAASIRCRQITRWKFEDQIIAKSMTIEFCLRPTEAPGEVRTCRMIMANKGDPPLDELPLPDRSVSAVRWGPIRVPVKPATRRRCGEVRPQLPRLRFLAELLVDSSREPLMRKLEFTVNLILILPALLTLAFVVMCLCLLTHRLNVLLVCSCYAAGMNISQDRRMPSIAQASD